MFKHICIFFITSFFLSCIVEQKEQKKAREENLPSIIELNSIIVDILDTIKPSNEILIFPFLEKFQHSKVVSNTLFNFFDTITVKSMIKQNRIFEYVSLLPWKLKNYNIDFKKKYDIDKNRYLGFSVPLLNLNNDSAIVEMNNFGNKMSGSGAILLLEKIDNGWVIKKRIPSWME